MTTVIYLGDFQEQKGIQISFSEAFRLIHGYKQYPSVDETIAIRRELSEGKVFETSNKGSIWMEEK